MPEEKKVNESRQSRPKGTVMDLNEPNFELMAKAFLTLYEKTKAREERENFK